MGEFELIRRFFERGPARRAELGIGDDCALLSLRAESANGALSGGATGLGYASLAVSTDMLVAGRHFFDDVSPATLGHKALAVNLSDLAAMGAEPRAFMLALALPAADEQWLGGFSKGMFALADRFGCELIGGDTTKGPLNVCITIFGDCPSGAALRRDRAEPDDDLWVSGELGAAAYAVRERLAGRELQPNHPARVRLEQPEPRVLLGLALRHLARAAIDLSDGLIGDLGHITERSRVGAEIDWSALPVAGELRSMPEAVRQAVVLGGGDDYELLFTAAPENRSAIEALAGRLELRLSRIGRIVVGAGVTVLDRRGKPIHANVRSFDHFV
jgi:thiamine-monophosphate kinase